MSKHSEERRVNEFLIVISAGFQFKYVEWTSFWLLFQQASSSNQPNKTIHGYRNP